MQDGENLFLQVIRRFDEAGILQDVVLIGSWVLPIYRTYFDNSPEVPVLRTTDVDFLVGMPPRVSSELDVPAALEQLGFTPQWSIGGRFCKYAHPDMEVEFLIPELGRGSNDAIPVEKLHLSAQPLRYLSLAYDHTMIVQYHGHAVRVPEPEAFVLLKLLVIPRRKDRAKAAKDAETARDLGEFLLVRHDRTKRMKEIFRSLPEGWKKTIVQEARIHLPILQSLLEG